MRSSYSPLKIVKISILVVVYLVELNLLGQAVEQTLDGMDWDLTQFQNSNPITVKKEVSVPGSVHLSVLSSQNFSQV